MRTQSIHRALAALFALALSCPLAARAGDSTPPAITHSVAHTAAGQPVHLTARIVDESRIFPQIFFRYGTSGPFEAPLDLKKVKGQKEEYEVSIPFKSPTIEYYLECYDEFGNGPARAGSPESPLRVLVDEAKVENELPIPGSPPPAAGIAVEHGSSASSSPSPAAETRVSVPAPRPSAPPEGPKAVVTTRLSPPAPPLTAGEAAWHSALLPGWGQYRSERRIRGLAFGVATGASLVATLWLQVRAHQANTIYMNAPLSVRSQAYDQAVDYADARNTMLGVTIGLWALNVAEAYFLHGTKDPW